MSCIGVAGLILLARTRGTDKWIDESNPERLEIIHIAGNHSHSANQSGSRDECIFKMMIRSPVHELRPTTKGGRVRRKNAVALRHAVEPDLNLMGLLRILSTGNLNSRLYFADGHGGNVQ